MIGSICVTNWKGDPQGFPVESIWPRTEAHLFLQTDT